MKRFFHNSKGAVTILVTLLLIPSVLVSGTAVDAARIYTTRNAVQNANQLAANAALASYSSLLKDLYALFGFMSDDPKLAEMVDEYIGITIFGKDEDKGTFRSFIGSDEYSTSLDPSGNLRKTEVLKQQILEYMKFRGPAIIIQRIFGELGSGRAEKISEDSYILELKQDIDESLEEVLNRYKELYYAIMQADSCRESNGPDYMSVADSPFSLIMDELDEIRNDFETLEEIHEAYHKTFDPEKRTPLATKYKDTISDIIKRAGNIEQHLNDTKENAGAFKVYFIRVVTVAEELDRLKENLKRKVDTLRQRLQQGKCSQEIYDA
ncbi:MAG: pilus assembly protein TadG-related protein, partial [Oscillospiraceae bacterium]|nr:pilus assembly protein TadG-related protein [Oscillospiraceae bacterium]